MHSVTSSVSYLLGAQCRVICELPVGCTVSRHLCYQLAAQSHCQEPLDLKRALFSGDQRVKGQQPRTHNKGGGGGGEGGRRRGGWGGGRVAVTDITKTAFRLCVCVCVCV